MVTSNYDVNVQLALATTAEYEGDLGSALDFLAEARRAARDDLAAHARVRTATIKFHSRHRRNLFQQAALGLFAAVF